jgi:hypothetical protein
VLEAMKGLTRVLVDPDADRLRLLVQRLRRCAGWVVAVVDDAGARDIILGTKDVDHSVIELSGIARQMRTVAKGGTA